MSKTKGNRLRFSLEEDAILINEIEKRPCLFDTKHKLYKDQGVRDNTWVLISELVGKNVEECKIRWKSLKDVYWKKQKGIQQGTRSAARESRKWDHMDRLAFLQNIERCRKIISTSVQNPDDDTTEYVEIMMGTEAEGREDGICVQDHQNRHSEILEYPPEEHLSTSKVLNKKRRTTTGKILDTICERSEESNDFLKQLEKYRNPRSHPIKTFFESMAETVMTFPPPLAVRAKKRVLEVISELELENCNSSLKSLSSTPTAAHSAGSSSCQYEN